MKRIDFFKFWLSTQRSLLAFHLLFFVCFNAVLLFSTPLDKSMTDVLYLDLLYLGFLLTYLICKLVKYRHVYGPLIDALATHEKNIVYYVPEHGDSQAKLMQLVTAAMAKEHMTANHSLVTSLQELEDYATLWVHEMKTPLAIMGMHLSTLESPQLQSNFQEELDRIAHLTDQLLYYSRSNDFSKDYLIAEVSLNRVIAELLKKHANTLIRKKLSVHFELPEKTVLSDKKWLGYILEQALVNAIKYTPQGGSIGFELSETSQATTLNIKDTGVGILTEDLPRVFEKGFTGQNGRLFGASTGMGLYLAQKLSMRLGHELSIDSKLEQGTAVSLTFYKFSDRRNLTAL